MFQQLTPYLFTGMPDSAAALSEHLERCRFVPCGATQQRSSGWVPPREEHGAFVEAIGDHWVAKLAIESKSVPAAAIQKAVAAMSEQFEQLNGRKPGKKLTREFKDQALIELLPQAFAKRADVTVWIDPRAGLIAVGTASASKAEQVVADLVRAVHGLMVSHVITKQSPAGAMTSWLAAGEAPADFTIDRDCELKAIDEMKTVVKYRRAPLDTDDVKAHVISGKVAKFLAMTWRDRVSFILNDDLSLKRVAILDVVMLGGEGKNQADDAFDADITITTGELSPMLSSLFAALGGLDLMTEGGAE